ncbi:hypothetical protein SAMN04488581_2608 [Mycolicibacterium neoaurum]|uniref:hypothetical protein n=1 Tax=Mycolicibacterium neoaurum TaxID=1795 RepID=UPI000560303C|nr:hypothetical protein [Mycolicibacterium neoaurum]SDD58938.1 hypothetical protein SAMN04488581_2608 [Mycolicibacterium neoaurum]
MTSPTPPEGKFVTASEVTARYEDDFPSDRLDWLKWRIFDVENALMGVVPSLRKDLQDIESESVSAGDPGRVDRVKSLVVEKVLGIFRNPTGVQQHTQTVDDVTESRSYYRGTVSVGFSDSDLDQVRLKSRRRSKIGSIPIEPWRITC